MMSESFPPVPGLRNVTTMASMRSEKPQVKQIASKLVPVQFRLKLACMKSESLVIANRQVAVRNTFPGLVHTARQTMVTNAVRFVGLRWGEPGGVGK